VRCGGLQRKASPRRSCGWYCLSLRCRGAMCLWITFTNQEVEMTLLSPRRLPQVLI